MMASLADIIPFFFIIPVVLGQNYKIANLQDTNLVQCYECNVWKAGYGQLCDNPRIRDQCYSCMKVETIIFMGYYKNTPRYSTVISRACANSRSVPFYNECQKVLMGDGHSRRCYCNTNLCNAAVKTSVQSTLIISSIAVLFALVNHYWL